ncbi:hypothetical protein Tco_0628248 [Tanacetum coccineum]|uniref:Transposase n=1 Tax=Tanacetum coccineum TaxID=301880 RepID=A0ABQ4WQJ2_9ASTR
MKEYQQFCNYNPTEDQKPPKDLMLSVSDMVVFSEICKMLDPQKPYFTPQEKGTKYCRVRWSTRAGAFDQLKHNATKADIQFYERTCYGQEQGHGAFSKEWHKVAVNDESLLFKYVNESTYLKEYPPAFAPWAKITKICTSDRLQRLYKSSHTAKEMTWHATRKCTEPGKMQHPVDGRAWKNFDTKYLNFEKEPRNVRLGLAADGFNPFDDLSQPYSMWPVILTTYNLPWWLCMKESSFMLTLLIPGPKSPGKDIIVYLRPLIDDLNDLWALKGVETIDVATSQKFNIRAMVLWTINDFLARSNLSGWSGQGYKACPTCNEDTLSMRVLGKTAYVGHRRFLKKPYKWRRSLDFNDETKDEDPPRKFNHD